MESDLSVMVSSFSNNKSITYRCNPLPAPHRAAVQIPTRWRRSSRFSTRRDGTWIRCPERRRAPCSRSQSPYGSPTDMPCSCSGRAPPAGRHRARRRSGPQHPRAGRAASGSASLRSFGPPRWAFAVRFAAGSSPRGALRIPHAKDIPNACAGSLPLGMSFSTHAADPRELRVRVRAWDEVPGLTNCVDTIQLLQS